MNDGVLTFAFNEPVLAASFNCSALWFLSSADWDVAEDSVGITDRCLNPNSDSDVLTVRSPPHR